MHALEIIIVLNELQTAVESGNATNPIAGKKPSREKPLSSPSASYNRSERSAKEVSAENSWLYSGSGRKSWYPL